MTGYYDPRDEDGNVNPADVLSDEELREYYEDRRSRPRPRHTGWVLQFRDPWMEDGSE